jgi:hypothetical protein
MTTVEITASTRASLLRHIISELRELRPMINNQSENIDHHIGSLTTLLLKFEDYEESAKKAEKRAERDQARKAMADIFESSKAV